MISSGLPQTNRYCRMISMIFLATIKKMQPFCLHFFVISIAVGSCFSIFLNNLIKTRNSCQFDRTHSTIRVFLQENIQYFERYLHSLPKNILNIKCFTCMARLMYGNIVPLSKSSLMINLRETETMTISSSMNYCYCSR